MRIHGYKHKSFGKKITDAIDEVKRKDHELTVMAKTKDQHGLMTAQLGSVYDVPIASASTTDGALSTSASTKVASSVKFSDTSGAFTQTEGATYKPPFKTFYTNGDQEAKFTTTNKFEGRSNYFAYYPTTDIKEQQLEQIWFAHKNQ